MDSMFLRDGVRLLAQELIEDEVTEALAAPTNRRIAQWVSLAGWDTPVGTVELAIPKLRQGSYFVDAADSAAARETDNRATARRGRGRRFFRIRSLRCRKAARGE